MRHAAVAMLALAVAGCSFETSADQLENSIRENLGNQAAVEDVNLIEQEDGNMAGYALVRDERGRSSRLNCAAHRSGDDSQYLWTCRPVIDETAIENIEASIRDLYARQEGVAEVDVEMRRHNDDDHMIGHAVLRDAAGNELRLACTSERDRTNTRMFNSQCRPEGEPGAAPADAGAGGKDETGGK